MRKWSLNKGPVVVLCGVLLVILLVLVLPQVDLLDTAFQRGTAPVVIHSLATASRVLQALPASLILPVHVPCRSRAERFSEVFTTASGKSFSAAYHSFRC